MDWIRKMNNTPNISGTNGKLLNVTEEELAKHNKQIDCWTAIAGRIKTENIFKFRVTFVESRKRL